MYILAFALFSFFSVGSTEKKVNMFVLYLYLLPPSNPTRKVKQPS